jgi:hypothetical protein
MKAVFEELYKYMTEHGVIIEREVLHKEDAGVLNMYAEQGNAIYNGK